MGDQQSFGMALGRVLAAFALLAICAQTASPDSIVPEDELIENAVPSDGKCKNEGDFAIGNHCVKLGGSTLVTFQEKTHQNFGAKAISIECFDKCPPTSYTRLIQLYMGY